MDFIFKVIMVVVAVAMVAGMMTFVFTSLSKTKPEEDVFQLYSGDNESAAIRIRSLCKECLSSSIDRDCFMLDLDIKQDLYISDYALSLTAGKHTLKISNEGGRCNVKES